MDSKNAYGPPPDNYAWALACLCEDMSEESYTLSSATEICDSNPSCLGLVMPGCMTATCHLCTTLVCPSAGLSCTLRKVDSRWRTLQEASVGLLGAGIVFLVFSLVARLGGEPNTF